MGLTQMIEAGGANPLLLFIFALMLGALHGLEPGHSKTMMAAYIIAVQGTIKDAVLLGVSAALSHSIIVWILALVALTVGNELIGEQLEPWFMVISGVLVLGIAGWMLWTAITPSSGHDHSMDSHAPHSHDHHHHHHDHHHGALHHHHQHGTHHHHHYHGDDIYAAGMDAHARAHAQEISARVADGRTGPWQTVLFGLSGGLIPCPAAITVFILCLHLGQLTLGITLVSAFSIGLALTLVLMGVVAAIGMRALAARSSRFDRFLRAAPWVSAALIALVGVVIIWSGVTLLTAEDHGHLH